MVENFHHTSCAEIEKTLDPYLDGELSDQDKLHFLRHIDRCSHCASSLELARSLLSKVRLLSHTPLPPGVADRLRAKLRAEREKSPRIPNLTLVRSSE
jgi:anti-sigma factor (TIGR02949 family)